MVLRMIMIYNFALSTHLIVDTGCQFYLHMSYIGIFALLPEMYARACDRCVYGYAIILYVIILTSQFYNYIDHTSTIIHLGPTICSKGKVQREMYIYTTTPFICEVWYMYVFKYEWRENQNTLSQCVNIHLLLYLSIIYSLHLFM